MLHPENSGRISHLRHDIRENRICAIILIIGAGFIVALYNLILNVSFSTTIPTVGKLITIAGQLYCLMLLTLILSRLAFDVLENFSIHRQIKIEKSLR